MVEHLFIHTPVQSIAAWYEWANPASGAVMKKCGFVYEKELMDKRKADSPPQDTVPCAYCRLWRGQWAARGGQAAHGREEEDVYKRQEQKTAAGRGNGRLPRPA